MQPALVGCDTGDVSRPDLIGGAGREVALQQVQYYGQIVFAVGAVLLILTMSVKKPVLKKASS